MIIDSHYSILSRISILKQGQKHKHIHKAFALAGRIAHLQIITQGVTPGYVLLALQAVVAQTIDVKIHNYHIFWIL